MWKWAIDGNQIAWSRSAGEVWHSTFSFEPGTSPPENDLTCVTCGEYKCGGQFHFVLMVEVSFGGLIRGKPIKMVLEEGDGRLLRSWTDEFFGREFAVAVGVEILKRTSRFSCPRSPALYSSSVRALSLSVSHRANAVARTSGVTSLAPGFRAAGSSVTGSLTRHSGLGTLNC